MEQASKKYPVNAKDYKLYEEVGEGVSATVYRALCIPFNEIIAIKVLDLEKCNSDLDGVRREVQTMILINHPNVLRSHCSFTTGHNLWVVMPYMAGGSCLHIMKSSFPDGFEETVIVTLLREVLKALAYLHAHGHLHRDVKAGNILVGTDGAVKLGDFGVAAGMFDTGDRQRSRNTFVGTPCWMAPEVMQQLHGYDFKADIWSFGITALELAHGHAPFSKYPPMKVLLMTLQNAPPGLDYERDKKFSKSFKEMVAACLVKDPKKRPTSEKLLKHSFFKHARPNEYLIRTILDGLAPLGDRFRMLKAKEADLLMQNKDLYGDKEQLSQQEYIRGISAWNFNLEDLKSQAALIQDEDLPNAEDPDMSKKQRDQSKDIRFRGETVSPEMANDSNASSSKEDTFTDLDDLESIASFPIKPLQALKGCFDICEDDVIVTSPTTMDQENAKNKSECSGQSSSLRHAIPEHKKFLSGTLLPDSSLSSKRIVGDGDRDYQQSKYRPVRNFSGPLYRQKRDTSNPLSEDTSEGAVVQRKGRFKVLSADLSPKGPTNCFFGTNCGDLISPTAPYVTAASLLPSLQSILQQNTIQREETIKLIKYLEQTSGKQAESADTSASDLLQVSPTTPRERDLLLQLLHLQQSIPTVADELQRQKMKNSQLQKQLNALANKDKTQGRNQYMMNDDS